MFNTITRKTTRPRGRWASVIGVAILQVAVVVAILVSTLYVTGTLPQPADMMAFVVTAPPPAPPPPPPPPPEVKPPEAPPQAGPVPEAPKIVEPPPVAAPVEAPKEITAETGREAEVWKGSDPGAEKTTTGGVGSVTGIDTAPPAPPAAPVRVGGSVSAPKLTKRVEPEYPSAAQTAKIQGTVILEATVDEQGSVDAVKVLRSNPLLDQAALTAVKQWKYQPLLLNGKATPFILTVTVSFGFS